MRIVFWGTYDTGKPRNRILLRGLRENRVELIECHTDVWSAIEDKSQIKTLTKKVFFLLRWLFSYPSLVFRYLRLPRHDAVIVGYLGQLDVLVLWPFAKLRRAPVVWDAFLSLYDTVVHDRQMVGRYHPLALLLYGWEWLACRAADCVVLDTRAHAQYFVEQFGIPARKTCVVIVGAEMDCFSPMHKEQKVVEENTALTVLFYGQFIPLHGIETIVKAARLTVDDPVRWILIGSGQDEWKIRAMLDAEKLPSLKWIPWVEYEKLIDWISQADVCLGIFGASGKAARVIPNKVFQILAAGKPLITRDSPAIRELLLPDMDGVALVPAADAPALADAVRELGTGEKIQGRVFHRDVAARFQAGVLAGQLLDRIEQVAGLDSR